MNKELKDKLMNVGSQIASIWGGACIDFEVDRDKEEVNFLCIEHDEGFCTSVSFTKLRDEYKINISLLLNN